MNSKFYTIIRSLQMLNLPSRVNNSPLHKYISKSSISTPHIRLFCVASDPSTKSNEVSYNEIKRIGSDNRKDNFIIDVRQPEELKETGVIPGSVNVPLDELETALKVMTNEQFQKKYGREKPKKDSLIVFSCRSGVRSAKAMVMAQQLGFKQSKNYVGGWLDWEEHLKK